MYKVLVVDDEQRTLEGISRLVETSGYDVCVAGLAHDGGEALELVRTLGPEIIFCDIRMAGMDGIAFAIEIRQQVPDMVIVFVSGYAEREYLRTAIRLGVIDFLDKPIDINEFHQALGRAVSKCAERRPAERRVNSNALELLISGNDLGLVSLPDFQYPPGAQSIVLVLRFINVENTDNTQQQIDLYILHIVSVFSQRMQYRYTTLRRGSDLIFLITSLVGEGHEFQPKELARAIFVELPDMAGHVSIGIGHRFTDLADTEQSYHSACKALERVFFRGAGVALCCDETRGGCYGVSASLYENLGRLCRDGELPQVQNLLEIIYAGFAENERTPICQIREATVKNARVLMLHYKEAFYEDLVGEDEIASAIARARTVKQLLETLRGLIKKYWTAVVNKDKKNGAIYNAKKFIWNYLEQELTIEAVARAVYLSPTYLCALFKEITGTTISKYVQQTRIGKAKTLLLATDVPICELAETVGFKNQNYFARQFVKHTGVTPKQYRMMNLEE